MHISFFTILLFFKNDIYKADGATKNNNDEKGEDADEGVVVSGGNDGSDKHDSQTGR